MANFNWRHAIDKLGYSESELDKATQYFTKGKVKKFKDLTIKHANIRTKIYNLFKRTKGQFFTPPPPGFGYTGDPKDPYKPPVGSKPGERSDALKKRVALTNWLKNQNKTEISRADITKQVGKIWSEGNPVAQTSRLFIDYPEIFPKNIRILDQEDISGSKDFKKYLKTTNKRPTTVPKLIKDFETKTGKIVHSSVASRIAGPFKDKFNLTAAPQKLIPTALETKAMEAYKKLSDSTKISFQTGGPGQQGAYNKWLTNQGLRTDKTGVKKFWLLLKRAGIYERAPVLGQRARNQLRGRAAKIRKTGSSAYEADLVEFKKNVLKNLKVPFMKWKGGGERVPIDQAHRLSYKQLSRFGEKYTGSNIGADWIRTNISTVRKLEHELTPFYNKQYSLWKEAKKLKTIPKNLTESLDRVNNQIAEIAAKSGGRLQGVQVDPYNLKVGSTPINYKYAADLGMTDVPLSKIKVGSLADFMFKLNYGEQIKNESIAAGLINKAPKNFKKLLEARVGCADGCLVQVAKNEPGKITRALTTLPDKAKSFFGLLGKFGTKAAPLAALAGVGAVIEPLVKQFVADDPSTYLTNENQMKGMLLATIEGETPKVDEEILKWQMPALGAATAAGAIPGAGELYKTRRGVGPTGPLPGGVGKARAALGISGVLGKALGATFSPLAGAATLPLTVAAQRKGGTEWGDIATDPMNWMTPAFASAGAEMATKGMKSTGIMAQAIRLGMSPRTLRLVSSRLGWPGLAVSAGMWGYDKWKNRSVNDED